MFFSQKCWWKSCYGTSTMPAAPETKMRTMILASTQTQSMLSHNADARHSLVGQDLPSYALLQRCESTSFTCCGVGGKQQIRDKKQNRNGSCCLGKPATIYDFRMFIRKEQGGGSHCRWRLELTSSCCGTAWNAGNKHVFGVLISYYFQRDF